MALIDFLLLDAIFSITVCPRSTASTLSLRWPSGHPRCKKVNAAFGAARSRMPSQACPLRWLAIANVVYQYTYKIFCLQVEGVDQHLFNFQWLINSTSSTAHVMRSQLLTRGTEQSCKTQEIFSAALEKKNARTITKAIPLDTQLK